MSRVPRPREHLLSAACEPHGGPDEAELRRLGISPEHLLDFSVCVNPYGPAPGVLGAIASSAIDTYPDRACRRLRAVLSELLAVQPCQIVVGNGTSELIGLVALAFLSPGERVLVLGPTYGEYARAARSSGGEIVSCPARVAQQFRVDETRVRQTLGEVSPRLVFLCNPNNPTGTLLPAATLADWADRQPTCLFVVDEAYLAFAPAAETALSLARDNILVLRSLTKDHALAGLRLGFAVGPEPIIAALQTVQTPWSVSNPAQAAGLASLRDRAHLEQTLAELRAATQTLTTAIHELGLAVLPSATHYFLVEVGDAARLRSQLLLQGILVRDCTSFGLPTCVRIATRQPADNERLLTALRSLSRI